MGHVILAFLLLQMKKDTAVARPTLWVRRDSRRAACKSLSCEALGRPSLFPLLIQRHGGRGGRPCVTSDQAIFTSGLGGPWPPKDGSSKAPSCLRLRQPASGAAVAPLMWAAGCPWLHPWGQGVSATGPSVGGRTGMLGPKITEAPLLQTMRASCLLG